MENNAEHAKMELEDQFILRLPPDDAKYVRKALAKKPKKIKKNMSIAMNDDMRNASVKVHGKVLHGRLFDLPTTIDSNKTVDGVHLFKSANVSQMLICQEDEFPDVKESGKDKTKVNRSYQYDHGLTPPLKNVRKFRFRKTLRNKEDVEEAADIEKEVLWLLRMDNEAVSTKYELIYDDKPSAGNSCQPAEISEMTIFGEKLSDIESDKVSKLSTVERLINVDFQDSASTGSESNDIMDFTN